MASRVAKRLWTLSGSELRLVGAAGLLTTGIEAALTMVSFKTLVAMLDRRSKPQRQGSSGHSVETITWAVRAVGRRIPGSTCLVQALAAQTLLRRAGVAAQLKVGILNVEGFEAHAWVVVGDRVVIGASDKAFVDFPLVSGAR